MTHFDHFFAFPGNEIQNAIRELGQPVGRRGRKVFARNKGACDRAPKVFGGDGACTCLVPGQQYTQRPERMRLVPSSLRSLHSQRTPRAERARYLGHLSMLVGCTGHQLRDTLVVSGVALGGRFSMSRKRQSNVVGGRPVRLNLRLSDIEYASLLTSAEELRLRFRGTSKNLL